LYNNNPSDPNYQQNTLASHVPGDSLGAGSAYAFAPQTTTTAPGPVLSDDGRFVAFASQSNNLVSPNTPAGWNIFLFDRLGPATKNVTRITKTSIPTNNVPNTLSPALTPSISGDGRYVAYIGLATDVPGTSAPAYTLARDPNLALNLDAVPWSSAMPST